MIRIGIELTRLTALVDQASAGWRTRAAAHRENNIRAGCHVDAGRFWSKIKPILIRLQHGKCAYCERQLESTPVEWDVEHFRPKGKVVEWTSDRPEIIDAGGPDKEGYFRLSYELSNYLAACKTCNSDNKANYFPTAAARYLQGTEPGRLAQERPYLINPVDPGDADPEGLIKVVGVLPEPARPTGFDRDRARVTINVLGLATREGLVRDRARTVVDVYVAFHAARDDLSPRQRARAGRLLATCCSERSPHTNCARVMRELCKTDPPAAENLCDEALLLLESPGS